MVGLYLVNCDQIDIVGTDSNSVDGAYTGNLGENSCRCDQDYHPICIADRSYFNPCVAGCTAWSSKSDISKMSDFEQSYLVGNCTLCE